MGFFFFKPKMQKKCASQASARWRSANKRSHFAHGVTSAKSAEVVISRQLSRSELFALFNKLQHKKVVFQPPSPPLHSGAFTKESDSSHGQLFSY